MSNLLFNKSFGNTSGINVDAITTKTINNITYNSNVNDISGYITSLYQSVGFQNNYLNTLSGSVLNINSTLSNQFNYLNSLSGSIKKINSGTFDGGISLKGTSLISNVGGVSTLDMNGLYIRKNSNGSVHFNMTTNSDYSFYSDFGSHRMTLGSSGLTLENALSSQSINTNGYNINCGNLTCDNGALTISPSSLMSSLYLDNFYIRREANNNITYYANGNFSHQFYANNGLRMTLSGGGLALTVPIFAGSNAITCGPITSSGNSNFGSITTTGLTANNIYCGTYGSQGGNLSIASPFGMYFSTSNNCDTVFSSNRYFFQTATGGNIECAFNWGSTAQNGNYSMTINGCIYAWGATMGSDDRIKGNEQFITNATETLLKLRPQIYNKYNNFDCSGSFIRESGLIAQEIYYDAPELKHIVSYSKDANISGYIASSIDPSIDPDYSSWGSSPAGVSYTQLIPYLVKSIQELNARIHILENR